MDLFLLLELPPAEQARLKANDAALIYCHPSHFNKVWRENKTLSRIKVRKWLKFSKCDDCIALRAKLPPDFHGTHLERSGEIKRRKRQYTEHIDEVKIERAGYWGRKRDATIRPDESMSIIVDGADVRDDGIPHFHQKSYALQGKFKLGVHTFGVLVHGMRPFIYLVQDQVKLGEFNACDICFSYFPTFFRGKCHD